MGARRLTCGDTKKQLNQDPIVESGGVGHIEGVQLLKPDRERHGLSGGSAVVMNCRQIQAISKLAPVGWAPLSGRSRECVECMASAQELAPCSLTLSSSLAVPTRYSMAKKSAASKSKSAQATTTSILRESPAAHHVVHASRADESRSCTSADAPLPAPSTSALVERSEEAPPPPPVVLPPKEKVPKINTSSLAELKNTCDDVVKEVRRAVAHRR